MYIERERECKCKIVYPWRTHQASLYNRWLMDSLNTSPTLSKNPKWNPHTHTDGERERDDGYRILCWISRRPFPYQSRRQWAGEFRFICWRIDSSSSSQKKIKIVLTFLRRFQIQLIVQRKGGTSCSIDAFEFRHLRCNKDATIRRNVSITHTMSKWAELLIDKIDRHIPKQFPFLITKREADYRDIKCPTNLKRQEAPTITRQLKKKF
jgi:hypothetical protein